MRQKYDYCTPVINAYTFSLLLIKLQNISMKWLNGPISKYYNVSKLYRNPYAYCKKYITLTSFQGEMRLTFSKTDIGRKLVTWNKFIDKCKELEKEHVCTRK